MIRIWRTWEDDPQKIRALLTRPPVEAAQVSPGARAKTQEVLGEDLPPKDAVAKILSDVESRGAEAVLHYTKAFDGAELAADELVVDAQKLQVEKMVDDATYRAMERAKDNIASFHRKQLPNSWFETGEDGTYLGMRYTPLDSVGVYVPGGSAPLVSSVLMTVVPAKVATVERIVMATPPGPDGKLNPYLLAAAKLAGVTQILCAGGAHGIGALAYGIQGLDPVDKIVGPGNLFVTLAKKQVLGRVGIDMLAGPSEVLVVADETAKPHWVAADLLSQAEHGADSAAILITTSLALAEAVLVELESQCKKLSRESIAAASLAHSGRIVVCRDLAEAASLANIVAPEHLELAVAEPAKLLGKIRHAGAIFMGHHSPEPVGDYFAGPNHVLPTNGTARFSSPLGTRDYLRRSSIIGYSEEALARDSSMIEALATIEGLCAHRNAVAIRRERK